PELELSYNIYSYTQLQNLPYQHETVNHEQNLVESTTGAHTQNVERLWREMRAALPRYGIRTYHYETYVAEFIFKRHYK
ncbi:hypothetical protein EAG_11052, partial [Camponotus floridanus]